MSLINQDYYIICKSSDINSYIRVSKDNSAPRLYSKNGAIYACSLLNIKISKSNKLQQGRRVDTSSSVSNDRYIHVKASVAIATDTNAFRVLPDDGSMHLKHHMERQSNLINPFLINYDYNTMTINNADTATATVDMVTRDDINRIRTEIMNDPNITRRMNHIFGTP